MAGKPKTIRAALDWLKKQKGTLKYSTVETGEKTVTLATVSTPGKTGAKLTLRSDLRAIQMVYEATEVIEKDVYQLELFEAKEAGKTAATTKAKREAKKSTRQRKPAPKTASTAASKIPGISVISSTQTGQAARE